MKFFIKRNLNTTNTLLILNIILSFYIIHQFSKISLLKINSTKEQKYQTTAGKFDKETEESFRTMFKRLGYSSSEIDYLIEDAKKMVELDRGGNEDLSGFLTESVREKLDNFILIEKVERVEN